jgi:hypothetical protein
MARPAAPKYTTQVTWDPVLDEPPCALCPHIASCREGRLACQQFAVFAKYGGRRWRKEAREPSSDIYAKVFKDGPPIAA